MKAKKASSLKAKSHGNWNEGLGMKAALNLLGKESKEKKNLDKTLDKKWHEKEAAEGGKTCKEVSHINFIEGFNQQRMWLGCSWA